MNSDSSNKFRSVSKQIWFRTSQTLNFEFKYITFDHIFDNNIIKINM